ncbi:MAG: hypothetical protein KJO56_11385 [Gammaproteobacteria bacterium]|nr:hypothetical protein [Gammaproteobacteria bacterium]MBT8104773.1 hypothetical protein [Gammaproteobacteria bacterium]NNK24787.1 hypothetical protein [Woeseiaceae bacterium]
MKFKYTMLLLILVASQGSAHGTADNHLQIMVVDNRIKMNIVVDMRVLHIADADKDGYASLEELAARSHEIKRWVRQSFSVTDSDDNSGNVVFADITADLNIASANGDSPSNARPVSAGQRARRCPNLLCRFVAAPVHPAHRTSNEQSDPIRNHSSVCSLPGSAETDYVQSQQMMSRRHDRQTCNPLRR